MDMNDEEESRNVVDVRGSAGGGYQFRPAHGIGLGTIVVALIGGWILGVNPLQLLGLLAGGNADTTTTTAPPVPAAAPAAPAGPEDAGERFVRQVLHSTEVVWTDAFRQRGLSYEPPKLYLFRDSYPTACGEGQAASGPFYCGNDRIVYLDMSFFDVMSAQLGAPGEFARAYVVGHEVGHHVQNLLGILDKVNAQRERVSEAESNALSVRLELQADCFAGVWATRSQQEKGWRLQPGDIDTALHAASQIGDDTLQRRARGTVVPESFTHGTSAERVSWFRRGVDGGESRRLRYLRGEDALAGIGIHFLPGILWCLISCRGAR
jgi:predicted metalloprotease